MAEKKTDSTLDKAKKIYDKLSPKTRRKVLNTIISLPRLEGLDQQYATASTIVSVLNDTGQLTDIMSRDKFEDAIGIFDLGTNWDRLSDVSKFIKAGKATVNLANKYGDANIPYAGDALSLAGIGYSQYQLINNFDKMNTIQKVVGVVNTMQNVSDAYGIVGSYTSTAGAAGGSATGGGGAVAAGAESTGILGQVGQAVPWIAAAYSIYNMVEGYGQGGADGRKNGAMQGASAGAAMGTAVPGLGTAIGAAVGGVIGLAVGSVKAGKSVEQQGRDSYRDYFEKMGIFSKPGSSHQMTLADGSMYDVGVDGSKGRAMAGDQAKVVSDSSKILEKDKDNFADGKELRPYEVDYTNDLDFFANHALTGLKYIVGGGAELSKKSGEFKQMFGYMANGATSNANGREFTEENFNTSMANVRAQYAKAGITNSDQAYNILNQLKAEGKISEDQFNTSAQGIRTSFANDYDYAQTLNRTRQPADLPTVGRTEDFVSGGETMEQGV